MSVDIDTRNVVLEAEREEARTEEAAHRDDDPETPGADWHRPGCWCPVHAEGGGR